MMIVSHAAVAAEDDEATRHRAEQAYDRGGERFAQHDYAGAAEWFDLADRLAPAAPALESAMRSHFKAGTPVEVAKAGTLALEARDRYPRELPLGRLAAEVIAEASATMGRVDVRCDGCRLEIDGAPAPSHVFLTPGQHRFVGRHPAGGESARVIDVLGGWTGTVELLPLQPAPAPRPERLSTPRGVSPAFALGGATIAASLGVAAAGTWFGYAYPAGDALLGHARATGTRDPEQEAKVHGAETRTSVLLGAAIVVGAASTALALLFTRWHREPSALRASCCALRF